MHSFCMLSGLWQNWAIGRCGLTCSGTNTSSARSSNDGGVDRLMAEVAIVVVLLMVIVP